MKQYHLNKLSPELQEIDRIDLSKDFNEEIQNKIYDDLINYKVFYQVFLEAKYFPVSTISLS